MLEKDKRCSSDDQAQDGKWNSNFPTPTPSAPSHKETHSLSAKNSRVKRYRRDHQDSYPGDTLSFSSRVAVIRGVVLMTTSRSHTLGPLVGPSHQLLHTASNWQTPGTDRSNRKGQGRVTSKRPADNQECPDTGKTCADKEKHKFARGAWTWPSTVMIWNMQVHSSLPILEGCLNNICHLLCYTLLLMHQLPREGPPKSSLYSSICFWAEAQEDKQLAKLWQAIMYLHRI